MLQTPMPAFDVATALDSRHWLTQFSQASVQRALRYAHSGVLSALHLEWWDGDTLSISAQVQGTARKPYRTMVNIIAVGNRFDYVCECTCPVSIDCKHAAALLMAAAEMPAGGPAATTARARPFPPAAPRRKPVPATPIWRQWLRALTPADPAVVPAPVPNSAPTPPRQLAVLFDALTHRQPGELIASLVWVQPTQAGRLGKAEAVRTRGFGNDLEAGAIDDAWHDRIARLQMGEPQTRSSGHWFALKGRHGESLLEELLSSTAPCFWQKPANGELRRAPDQPLDWRWAVAADGEQTLEPAVAATGLIAVEGLWQWNPGARCLQRLTGETADLAAALLQLPPLPPEQAAELADAWRAHPRLRALPAPRVFRVGTPLHDPPVPMLRLLQHPLKPRYGTGKLDTAAHLPCARLEFDYGGQRLIGPAAAGVVSRIDGDTLHRIERQASAEHAAQAALHEAGLSPLAQRYDLRWQLRDEPHPADYLPARGASTALVLLQHATALQAHGFQLEFDPSFPLTLSAPPDDWYLDVTESPSGNAWFEAELGIEIDGERISLLPILQRALSDRRLSLQPTPGESADAVWYAPLDERRHIALPLSQVRALLAPLVQWLDDSERLRIPRVCAGVLDELSAVEQLRLHTRTAKAITTLATQLREGGRGQRVALPRTLKAQLRPYQRDGLDWLGFLARAGLGGVLADDMGLGKTVQVLAHLLTEKQARRLQQPALIVVPTSVIGNWREQALRFAPSLRVRVLHGSDRHGHFESLDDCDLAITTYALLPRDRESLRRQRFSLAVFDEAQALKNPRSQAAIVARELQATRRLVVTGTPLENHLGDLWAQFDCVLPGLLGDSKAFTRHFRTPIEKHGDPERQARLNRQVAPFLLRRSKEQVAPELPAKTEIVQTLELTGKQRALYETLRLAMHDKVQKAIAKRGLGQSSIIILDALLKLRQVCCDPRLVKLDAARTLTSSAKLDALLPMLEELLAEGRRILLFSQFTQMLDLIEAELRERKLRWLRLDGSTRDRDTPVHRFQAGDCPLFLISLKAGGVGLNLTAADTVIHFDPWWNPAVERQATDRAHRIGQDKPVFVYKLICRGTVEEKIQAMQQRKAALAEAVLSGGSRQTLRFDEDDIAALFAPLADATSS
ncbi:MAG: SNF2-related protein [Lysobacter sp.]